MARPSAKSTMIGALSAIGLWMVVALTTGAIGLSAAVAASPDEAANPFLPKPPDPFKQQAIPLPPAPSPKDAAAQADKLSAGRKALTEDDVYAAYQRGFFIEAFALATDRAGKGDPQAMTMVGHLYQTGQGIRQDVARAAEWFQLGADHGDREAQLALGLLYLNGTGVKADKAHARSLFEAAAGQDQPTALYNLALMAIEGGTVAPDIAEASRLMRRAAELGNAQAAYSYALMLDSTNLPGNEKDITYWMGIAARAGNVPAELEYAIRLAKGRGADVDLDTAVLFLNRAAWAGNAIAQNRLAHLVATGIGMPFDSIEAAKWHLLAKSGGVQDPQLEDLLATLKPEELARARQLAADWPNMPQDTTPTPLQAPGSEAVKFNLSSPIEAPRATP